MIKIDKNTEIFYIVDEFLKIFYQYVEKHHISYKKSKRRNRKYRMSDSEIITILILYHLSGY
ncbi:MAG: IS982 family transposase, partial [Bacteroidales bacterium]|nr:IS982 family transposase [Bacteroidales bacterium]